MTAKIRTLTLMIWLAVLLGCVLVIAQTRFVADLTAFMPRNPTQRQQLLVDQLHDGVIARLIMIGIEGGNPAERARLSQEFANALRNTQLFVGVENGDAATRTRNQAYFFDNRYLLSPQLTPQRFTVAGLHAAIADSIAALSGDAGMLLKQLLPRDPTNESVQLLEQFSGNSQPDSFDGVWVSRDGKRAVLMAYTRAPGTDTEAQAKIQGRLRQIFAGLPGRTADVRLLMSGTSVFSVSSRNTIQNEVSRLATGSFILVIVLLYLVYRSATLLVVGLLPVLSGILVGITAVSLAFGQVHGLTLGFGSTLIGEAVDYSIYFFLQQTNASHSRGFWRTIWLGMLTSVTGFTALIFSDFPGLAQLGLYSVSGLVAAAGVTRFVLPSFMPAHLALRDLRPLGRWMDAVLEHASHLRWLVLALTLAAAAFILTHSSTIWNRELSALSPITKTDQTLDLQLRNDLSAPDMRYILALTAPSEQAALQQSEQAGAVLQQLVSRRIIGGYSSPAFVLPSIALQRTRQAALPDSTNARRNLDEAVQGLPIASRHLQGFLTDLAAARVRQPLVRADLDGTSAALLVDSLLVKRKHDYLLLMPLRAVAGTSSIDLDQVNTALHAHGCRNAILIDLLEESTQLFDSYRHEALLLSGLGFLAIVALLVIALRSLTRTLRILAPLVAAVVCVTAAILLSGTQLTILHLIGLLLVVAIGSNYALFFERGAQNGHDEARRQMQISLIVANLTTVSSFGLLGISKIPVLSAIGSTVGPGAFLALLFAAILTRNRTVQTATDAHAK